MPNSNFRKGTPLELQVVRNLVRNLPGYIELSIGDITNSGIHSP